MEINIMNQFRKNTYKGRDSGFAEGRNEIIHSFIESLIECDIPIELIRNKLITKCNLSESDADLYLSEYFK